MRAIWLLLLLFSVSVSAVYQEMVLEGVKQADGVWTAAGTMDTMGFVRTTGTVTVAGSSITTSVALPVEKVAATSLLKSAGRLAGPVALALTAYDVYEWMTSDGISASGNTWVYGSPEDSTTGKCNIAFNGFIQGISASACMAEIHRIFQAPVFSCPPQYPHLAYQFHVNSCTGPERGGLEKPVVINTPPATQAQFDRLPIPSNTVLANGFNKIPSLVGSPIPITGLQFPPFSSWLSDPYFKDGSWYRDRVDISPCPTASQPTRVCVDIGPQKFEGATDPQTIPTEATEAPTGTTPKEQPSFCKENPQSIACQELGTAEPEPIVPDEVPFQLDTSQSWGASNASCPASPSVTLHTGKVITFNYQPTCNFLAILRPIIIAFAVLTAIFIAIGRTD